MRKIVTGVCCLCAAVVLQSCYCSTVCVGKMHPQEDAKCVGTSHNAHFFGGLVGSKKIRAKNYVDNLTDYKVKTFHSFGDQVVASITMGIYTPTTTKFYVNDDGLKKLRKRRNSDD